MPLEPPIIEGTGKTLEQLSTPLDRTYRLMLKGDVEDLMVLRIPVKHLYFSIENGRYADRMIRIKAENPGEEIDIRSAKWKKVIRETLQGLGPYGEERDKIPAVRLRADMETRKLQITPGVVTGDGGVVDGNRRLATLTELGWDYFEGVILPPNTSAEDKWRIEAGLQMGKPMVHDYSPANQLLKIREGLRIFREMKEKGQDVYPNRSPEDLVAESLWNVEPSEITEAIKRLELIEEYLKFIGKPARFDLVGERSERFKEALKVIDAAQGQGWKPEMNGKLKAWLFHSILVWSMDNWQLREIYRAIGGNPNSAGRKLAPHPKSEKLLKESLPDAVALRGVSKELADAESKKREPALPPKMEELSEISKRLGRVVVQKVDDEDNTGQPMRLLVDARSKLESLKASNPKWKEGPDLEAAKKELRAIQVIVVDLLSRLKD